MPSLKSNFFFWLLVIIFFLAVISSITYSDDKNQNTLNTSQSITTPIPSTPTPKPTIVSSSNITLNISYDAYLSYNNHVGNEWSYSADISGTYTNDGNNIIVNSGDTITINCYVSESDSVMDYGYNSFTIDPSKLSKGKSTYTCDVVVRENRGRYSGNTAGWTFTFEINKK